MQRCCTKLAGTLFSSSRRRLLSPLPPKIHASVCKLQPIPLSAINGPHRPALGFHPHPEAGFAAMQVRHFAAKAKDRSRAPMTPIKSKVKKYKLKCPSSMKFRFRTLNDGTIRRWHAGKRHNAHLKSKEAKRRLRKPALVHLAYAKVIKKLNFCG